MSITFITNHRFRILFVISLLLLPAAATRIYAAPAGCPPTSPGELEDELIMALTNQPIKCTNNWYIQNDPSFKNWGVGGSMNLPVVTATTGLYRFPNQIMKWWPKPAGSRNINPTGYQITYVNWWIWFLASQLREDPTPYLPTGFTPPPARARLAYFRGTELGSNLYDASVVASVIAVRYWAYKNGNTQLIYLSKKFLQANWVIYGMSAGSGPVWTYNIPGRTPNGNYNPAAPRRPAGGYRYAGHFLALAGTRSKLKDKWEFDDKFPLFDRAIEFGVPVGQDYENPKQTAVLDWLELRWNELPSAGPPAIHPPTGENLYALIQSDRDRFTTLIQTGSNAASFLPWLANIRTATTYRILGWDGWRASAMETNTNSNDTNMYGIAYRKDDPNDPDDTHALATFLFPYTDRKGSAVGGLCQLFPGHMDATNAAHPNHPVTTQSLTLPAAQPQFHLVLSPTAEAYLDTSSYTSWPPPGPPKSFDPGTGAADSGDTKWVTDSLPRGSITASDGETWNWTDANPAPYSDAGFVHQSTLVANWWHQHYFYGATETLTINPADVLYAYVYLDPTSPPSEVMLQWSDAATGWEHRAYWGSDQLGWGTNGTSSRRYMGPLPVAGQWIRLEVPASLVGLEGHSISGMAFSLFGGRATWDEAGKNDQAGLSPNLAIGAFATQSTTAFGGLASRAADGNPDGNYGSLSVSHTDSNYQAWWQVDLGSNNAISWINVWNRTDCCGDRLTNFYVLVSDVPFVSTDLNTTLSQSGVSAYYTAGQGGSPTTLAIGRTGRYVRVQLAGTNYLSLAEVEVFGEPASVSPPPVGTNVALAANGGVATASSTYAAGYAPSGAINGDRKGMNWGSGGGWNDATPSTYPDWLQIDFQGNKSINEIDVFTVQDNFTNPSEPNEAMTFTLYGIVDFLVQYWNGSSWITVPGGSVTGNNKVMRRFTFSPITTAKIRILVNNSLGTWSRISEVEAYGQSVSMPQASASVAWVQPSEVSWGPPNTMTAAGYAQNGSGGVQMVWRDETLGTGWTTVPFQPAPAMDGTWSNTLDTSNKCHTYRVYVNYSGVRSADFVYNGLTSGYCSENAKIIWIQPASTAGFGPPGSLVVAGSASSGPSGTQVYLSYRDVTAGTGWIQLSFAPIPDSSNIWYNAIDNANPFHQYQVQVKYDAVTSSICTYQGTNSITWCQ